MGLLCLRDICVLYRLGSIGDRSIRGWLRTVLRRLLCLLGLPLLELLPCAMDNLLALHIHLMHCFVGDSRSGIRHLVSGIFLGITFRRIDAVFSLVLGLDIGIFHPLTYKSSPVNGFYCVLQNILRLNIMHRHLPALWRIHLRRVWW